MSNLTIRNIPDAVLRGLRKLSKEERRSLNSEVLVLLEESLKRYALEEHDNKISMDTQTEIWGKLAGEWEDSRSADETIADVLSHRTLGRKVEF